MSSISFSYEFNQEAFQAYVRLYLKPHDTRTGFNFFIVYILFFGACLFISIPLFMQWENGGLFGFVVIFYLIYTACFSIFGLYLMSGLRRPHWNTKRWRDKTAIAFVRLKRQDTENPVCANLPAKLRPNDKWPQLFYFFILTALTPPPFANFLYPVKHDDELAFDIIPGILPRFKNVPEDVELSVQFSGAFYPDHIEKGSHGVIFAESYDDIHDVVEDQEHYPGLAILRHKDGYSELVVFTDKLEGGTWDEVKLRIFEACPDAFSDKEIARLTALQNGDTRERK